MIRPSFVTLIAFSCFTFVAPAIAGDFGDYYVTVPVLNERASPVGGVVLNRIYKGQKVTVYQVQDGWGRVTAQRFEPRWVIMTYLSHDKPPEPADMFISDDWRDPRIEEGAIPSSSGQGLTENDLKILWRGAKFMLDRGRCSQVSWAGKSVNQSSAYYLTCGANNIFFTEADLYE